MKAATAYERNGRIFLHASSETTAGIWVIDQPVIEGPRDDPERLGTAIRRVLDGSTENAPHPKSFANLFAPVLDLAGVKSAATFNKTARCVQIEQHGGSVTFIPTRNEGPDDGFTPLSNKQHTLGVEDDLGGTLLAAFAEG